MDNNYGKQKKGKKSKTRFKNKSNTKQRPPKQGHTIPNQTMGDNFEGSQNEKLISTVRDDNTPFLAMSNTIPKNSNEESKVEVIETGDKGSAKVIHANPTPEKISENPKEANNSGHNNSVTSNSAPPMQIDTGPFTPSEAREVNNDRVSLTQDQNRGEEEDQEPQRVQKKLNTAEIVPPIYDPNAQVFPASTVNILARSRKIKKKKKKMNYSHYNGKKNLNNTEMWGAFPGRKMKFSGKYTPSRGLSVRSGRSSRRRYKSSSRSSRSSRSRSHNKRYKSSRVKKMKRRYLKNILPHVGIQNKSKIVKKFTSPLN